MHGIHKDREAFRFKKRRKNAKAKAVKKKQAEFGLPQLVIEEYHAAVIEDDYSDGSQILEFDQMLEAAPNQWLGENNAHSVVALYTRAQLTKPQAIQLLQLYRMRHKLTDAGFEDLLELLNRSLLPANNTLPRTLYSFNKALDEDCVLRVQHRTKNFVVFNIRSQIADVIKSKPNFMKNKKFSPKKSCVGFALQRISCPNNALWQISERIKRIPANALDLTTKEWFSTTKQNFGQEFVRTIEDLRDSDANHQEIHQILIGRYPNENILMSKQIQLEHFILRSRALVGNFKDSLVFVQSAHDQSLHPVIVEVFYKIDDTIRALVRELKIETTFSDSLRWIRGDQTAFDLLTNRRAFANCCVVASEAGELFNVRAERIISKGLIVQNSDKLFAFPLFAFDHD